jgi:dTDP-glucose 4,6-dehydratase
MKNVLVTGGAGFIGSNFVRHMLSSYPGVRVVNLDALTYAGSLASLADLPDESRHEFVHGDIRDRDLVDTVFRDFEIDTVVHFAAESHVDRSILGPEPFVTTNVNGTLVLLEAARRHWVDEAAAHGPVRFHHVSTDEVYGFLGPDDPPFSETTPYDPSSPYSASKAGSDHLARAYHRTYGLPVTISNCSNNYGPYQHPEKLIPLVIFSALRGKPIPVYGDGRQIRDWLYVEDHCRAIAAILEEGRVGETYNVGGGNQPENIIIVRTLCGLLDEKVPESRHAPHEHLITFVTDRPGHDPRYAIDASKIASDLGWTPDESLETGLARTVDWYLASAAWVAEVTEAGDFRDWITSQYGK